MLQKNKHNFVWFNRKVVLSISWVYSLVFSQSDACFLKEHAQMKIQSSSTPSP